MCREAAKLFFFLVVLPCMTWPVMARADGETRLAQSSRPSPAEQYCAEEQQLAERWIQWAAHKRHECAVESDGPTERAQCLQRLRSQLDQVEAEYAEIYTGQVRNLRSDHPVVRRILQRLRSHKELASVILEREDAEPMTLAGNLKNECLAAERRTTPANRKR